MRKIMMPISEGEAEALKGVLEEAIDDVRGEIVRTEQWELKDALKEKERLLEHLASRLQKTFKEGKAA